MNQYGTLRVFVLNLDLDKKLMHLFTARKCIGTFHDITRDEALRIKEAIARNSGTMDLDRSSVDCVFTVTEIL